MAEPYPSNSVNKLQENCVPKSEEKQMGEDPISPAGVDIQQVHPAIFHLVEKIFAKPLKGLEFLSLLLTQAEVKQEALTDTTAQTPTAYAVVTLKNLRELARRIHWGYDTTQKYVISFCALDLLLKRRSSDHIELLFPLQHYTFPSSLNALDRLLLKSRPKVQQFARRIRERCVLYNAIGSSSNEIQESDSNSLSPEQELMSHLHSILCAEHIETERRQRLVKRISSEILNKLLIHATTQVSPPIKQGRLHAANSHPTLPVMESTHNGRLSPYPQAVSKHESTTMVDSIPLGAADGASESTAMVDSVPTQANSLAHESTIAVDLTTSPSAITERKGSESTHKVDSFTSHLEQNSSESTFVGRLGQHNVGSAKHESTTRQTVDFSSRAQKAYKKPNSLHDLIKNVHTLSVGVDSSSEAEVESTPTSEINDQISMSEVDSMLIPMASEVDSLATEPASLESLPITVDSTDETSSAAETSTIESTSLDVPTVDFEASKAIQLLKDPSAYSREFLALYVTLNVNEFITIIYKNNNNTNVTLRKDLQMFLAEVFEGNRSAWRNHQNLLKAVSAQALASGFVYTLLCLAHPTGKTIHNPAGLFTSRCKMFMENKITDRLDEVELLLQMPCEQLWAYLENPHGKTEGLSPLLQQLQQKPAKVLSSNYKKRGGKIIYREGNFTSTKLYGLERK